MSTAVAPLPDPTTPQVLLFGHTDAGKSSLLGALVRAGEVQGETLRGEVQESSGRLASLRDTVYRGVQLARTDTEVTSYTIRLRPWRVGSKAVGDPTTVILHDCSGKAAESLIRHPSSLHDSDTRCARAVIDADAIVLLVDAASNAEQLQDAFEEFDTFLTVVAQGKANAREVGGFPILLVLTKCDELVVPGDSRALWESRVHQRADHAWRQFDAFLKDADPHEGIPSPFLPFGSIDLTVYAVATRLPKLADAPAAPETPYQVAELFRDCFAAAQTHRNRVQSSNKRLKWTVRAVLSLVAVMFLGAMVVALFPPQRGDPDLAERVRGYSQHEPLASVRLADENIGYYKRLLTTFRDDPAFIGLPDDLRDFVTERLNEIDDYDAYRAKLTAAMAPGDTRTLPDLAQVEKTLREGTLALPDGGWSDTAAAQLRRKWLADVDAIREAEGRFGEGYTDVQKHFHEGYYGGFVRRGTLLTLTPNFGGNWRGDVGVLMAEAVPPPAPLNEPLPGSPAIPQPRGQAVTNRVPFEFERVYQTRKDWNATNDKLKHLRDLADALGLTAGPDRPEALLVLPEPEPGFNSLSLPSERMSALLRTFTRQSPDYHEWELSNFSDPGRALLSDRLERSFRTGSRHVNELIRKRLGIDLEQKLTRENRLAIADTLIDPATPFPEWGRFLHLLLRLRNPAAPNPVGELAAFLRESEFKLDFRGFDLVIPAGLSLETVTPTGPLAITVKPENGPAVTKKSKLSERTRPDAKSYLFTPEGDGQLVYRPGDEFQVELPVKVGTQDFSLVWKSGGSETYQFERLAREPRLVKAGGGSEPATGVKLTPIPGSTLPKMPALFPEPKK